MNLWVALGLSLGCPTASAVLSDGEHFGLELSADVFASGYKTREDGALNPGNQLALLPHGQYDAILKPELRGSWQDVELRLSPRLAWRSINRPGGVDRDSESWLQEGSLSLPVGEAWTLSLDRARILWGPSMTSSPSNPFFSTTTQLNPFVEDGARDFVRARHLNEDGTVATSLVHNARIGRGTKEYEHFHPITALLVEYTGYDQAWTLVAARSSARTHLGVSGQRTLSDEVLLYVDWGWRSRTDALAATRNADMDAWSFQPRRRGGTHDILLGFSYTTSGGDTFALEYQHNQQGMSRTQADTLYSLFDDAVGRLASGNAQQMGEAMTQLSAGSTLYARTMGRNYLHGQYLVRELNEDMSLTMRASHNVDDHGTQWVGVVEYKLLERMRLSSYLVLNTGPRQSEARAWFDRALFGGINYTFQ